MKTNSIEDGPQTDSSIKKWINRHKVLVMICIASLIVFAFIGIVLAIVLASTESKDKNLTPVKSDLRIDCVPWLKSNTDSILVRKECEKFSYCAYDSIDNNQVVPSCFYQKEKLAFNVTKKEDTSLGETYTIQLKAHERQVKALRIIFEYLDDNTLRFKVSIYLILD